MTKAFIDKSNPDYKINHQFAAYISWAQNFCAYALQVLKQVEEQVAIDNLNTEKETLECEILVIDSITEIISQEGLEDSVQRIYSDYVNRDAAYLNIRNVDE